MATYDSEFHPVTLGSESTDLKAGPLSRIGDAITKGIPTAAISGGLSIYNTFQDYTGGDAVQAADFIQKTDQSWGDYYNQHTDAVDMVGFVGTSLVPGMIGIKALKLARSGQAFGSVGRALNLTASRKQEYLEAAMNEVAKDGGTIKSILSANRARQFGWEVADQALMSTAFELAVAGTMNDSPVFDGDTVKDFAWNVALGTGIGGVVGGALGSIGAKGILKNLSEDINVRKRMVDTVFDPVKMGLSKGTETLLFAESIAKLPDAITSLNFKYKYDGIGKTLGLDLTGTLQATKDRAVKTAEQNLSIKFNELASGEEVVGQAYRDFLQRGMLAAKEAGKDIDEQIELINGYLANVNRIKPVSLDQMEIDAKKFYATLNPISPKLEDLLSLKRVPGATGKVPYVLAPDVQGKDLLIENFIDTGFTSLKDAWRMGAKADIIRMPNGRAAINPRSEKIRRIMENPNKVNMFVDLQNGSLADEAVVHFADTVQKGKTLFGPSSVSVGAREYRQAQSVAIDLATPAVAASARFAWASQLSITQLMNFTKGTIDAADLPMLSRAVELANEFGTATLQKLKIMDNGVATDFLNIDTRTFVANKKMELLAAELGKGVHYDTRHIAAHLNASQDFIDDAITRNFAPPKVGAAAIPDLPTADALRPKTVVVEWDFSQTAALMDPLIAYKQNMGPAFQANVELSRQYQLAARTPALETAFNTALGSYASRFLKIGDNTASESSQSGAGAGIFTSSNADYGNTAKLRVQESGKNVQLVSQQMRDEAIESLSPYVNRLRDSETGNQELGVLTNALRKSEFRYVFDPIEQNMLVSTKVLSIMKREGVDAETALAILQSTDASVPRVPHILNIINNDVADFIRAHTALNTTRQDKFGVLYNASGLTRGPTVKDIVYVPPVNTVKYPFHAFVRTKEQVGITSETTMITAKSEAQLRELVAKVDPVKYDVHYKRDTDMYFKAKGEYDYSMTLNESQINSDLVRLGKMADHFPESNFENVMTDYLEFHAKQSEKLVRTAVQVRDRQFFSEMRHLSDNYRVVSESVTKGIGSLFKKKVEDPFGDYIKTALNISKQQEFPLLDSLNDFVDKVSLAAGDAISKAFAPTADKLNKTIPWEEVDEISKSYGLGMPYAESSDAVTAYMAANQGFPKNVIRETLQKANMLLANFTLRLDFANSIVNIISTPIMLGTELASIKRMVADDAAMAGKLNELRSIKVPGQDYSVPSTTRMIGTAINNFFGPDKLTRTARYTELGAIKDITKSYYEVLDDLSINQAVSPGAWSTKVNAAVDKMSKYTANNFSEELTRFVSADVMAQLTDPIVAAGKMTRKEQDAYISTFVNRVQGNYITSQRPIVFQGTTGAAVSLFQTYAFNVLQQLHRHVEAGDKRTLAIFAGLQSTVFGFNGLPFFDAVNTHLIGSMISNNPEHKDAYNMLPSFNKELGDWMLYGTASAFPLFGGSMPALFSRGDINPRHITILPTNPLDVPAVNASLKLVDTVYTFGKNLAGGVDMSSAMLQGLEHQGINRPLAGFAQLLAGRSTTTKGSLISAASDFQTTALLGSISERVVEYGGVSRLLGARPMDEAVALSAHYRQKGYEALDRTRLASLGSRVKASLYNNEAPSDEDLEDFMASYVKSGGRIENFSQSMQRWSKDANVSVVNQMAQKLGSQTSQRFQELMGGEPLPDYRNQAVPPVVSE